jgi:anti-sigma B factor antagonist
MDIVVTEEGTKTIVNIDGRIDTNTSYEFEKAVMPLASRPNPDVEVNCEKLDYISSSGLRVFMELDKGIIANNGKIVLKGLNEGVMEIFKMTGFDHLFKII